MKVHVLGSAAGGGLRSGTAAARTPSAPRGDDPAVPPRSQPSIAIGNGDGRWSVINTSPDIRDQFRRFPGLHPRPGTRDVPIDSVVLTNADLDHVMGLLVLRESLPYRVVTTPWIRDVLLENNAAFRLMAPAFGCVNLDEPFDLDREGHLEAKLFPVPGKVPTYLQELATNSPEATLGLRVTDRRTGSRLVYAPGLQTLDEATLAELQGADVRFVDGTFWTADELLRMRPGAPDAWKMGHVPISGSDGSLARLKLMGGRTYYIHINNTNPILDANSAEAAAVREAGVEVSNDGLEVEV